MSMEKMRAVSKLLQLAQRQSWPRSLYWNNGQWISVPINGPSDMQLEQKGAKLVGVYTHKARMEDILEDMKEVEG